VDECRVELIGDEDLNAVQDGNIYGGHGIYGKATQKEVTPTYKAQGRFPANVILDEEAGRMLDEQSGVSKSRFFYCAKASKKERNAGLEGMEKREKKTLGDYVNPSEGRTASKSGSSMQNAHPTVKPIALMSWLVKLITREGHVVLDPFLGSGTTGIACKKSNRNFVGIEKEKEYIEIAEKRVEAFNETKGE